MKKERKKKQTLLKGEGANQHTLYGDFKTDDLVQMSNITVLQNSMLVHETPTGEFAEHNTLSIEKGEWVMGQQVEFNPFDQTVSRVWD